MDRAAKHAVGLQLTVGRRVLRHSCKRVRLTEQSSSSSRSDSSGIEKWWVCSAAPVELVVATALGEQRLQKTQTRLGLLVDGVFLLLGLAVLLL